MIRSLLSSSEIISFGFLPQKSRYHHVALYLLNTSFEDQVDVSKCAIHNFSNISLVSHIFGASISAK